MVIYIFCSVASDTAPALFPESTFFVEPCLSITSVLLELCVNLLDTALPPHDLFTGVPDTALLPSTGDGSPGCRLVAPLSGNQLHAPGLGPFLGSAWSPSHVSSSYEHPCH